MAKSKVLLAEDDVTMVSLLKTLLKMEGFDVVALQADDLHLATQSGLDILDEIRETQDVRDLRVVISSGSNVKEECLRHGANGFLLKPYMPDDLITILKQTIKSV